MRRCWTLSFAESVKKLIAVLQKKYVSPKGNSMTTSNIFADFRILQV